MWNVLGLKNVDCLQSFENENEPFLSDSFTTCRDNKERWPRLSTTHFTNLE